MKVIDPGHQYDLEVYDGYFVQHLQFMKREGAGYPGNVGHYPGTNLQEVMRVLIDRVTYLNNQYGHPYNEGVIDSLREAIILLEARAAERHKVSLSKVGSLIAVETLPTCKICGHIICRHKQGV